MATLSSEPGLRYSVSDWAANNEQKSDTAEYKRNISHGILRQLAQTDRINDLTRWKENLKACAQQVDAEMDALTLYISLLIRLQGNITLQIFK
uniref:Tektin n=1 Tax=Cyprinus carpio TaxID=7962 RepID=A0A8C2G9K1_CYPCA